MTVQLFCGDCLEIMPTISKVDAVVTDPPYGLGKKWTGGTWFTKGVYENDNIEWDFEAKQEWIEAMLSLDIPAVIWGGNYFIMPASRCWLSWEKNDNMPTMADFELAWTNLDRPSKRFIARRNGWERRHPTEKPLALMEWCLSFLPDAVTILDPFMGSGTTGVACVNLGRNFIGIEKDPQYFEIAKERIAEAERRKNNEFFVKKPTAPTLFDFMLEDKQ